MLLEGFRRRSRLIINWLSVWVPFVNSLSYFPKSSHKSAIPKFVMLWILTSLPVIVAALLSPIPEGSKNVLVDLGLKLNEAISISEQFVYTASYLSPVLYILWEKYQFGRGGHGGAAELGRVFRGYGWVAAVSLITIVLTATAFSALKTDFPVFKRTFLYTFLVSNAGWIYLFSLYCFYLSILDGNFAGDYVMSTRQSENRTADDFSARLRNRSLNG